MFVFLRLLSSELGQVPAGQESDAATDEGEGTGEAVQADDDPFEAAKAQASEGDEGAGGEADATQGQGQAQGHEAQSAEFTHGSDLDPRKLPPELQPIFKRMQGVYTKKMQGISELKGKADLYDRFYSDPGFASQTLIQYAAQNGYQLTPIGQQAGQGQTGQPKPQAAHAPNPALVESIKQGLPAELHWMAEAQATAMEQAMRTMLEPVFKQSQQQTQQQLVAEYDRHAAQLSEVAPGWEEHEDAMAEMNDFLKSSAFSHPKFGSKHQLLYNLVTANAGAMKQATQRVANAAKNRVSSGRTAPRTEVPLADQMAKKSSEEAWGLAVKHALQQVQAQRQS